MDEAREWWSEHRSGDQAARWFSGFSDSLFSLQEHPERFPLADENDEFPYEIRELYFGLGSRPTHRAVYTIHFDVVVVLSIRHTSQDRLTPTDL